MNKLLAPSFLLLFFFTTFAVKSQQYLTISNSGHTGTSGTNWSSSGTNPVTITATGDANINASVVVGYLNADISVIINSNSNLLIANNIVSTSDNSSSLTFKVNDRIRQAAGVTVSTNGGNITYWSDTDNNGSGVIEFALDTSVGPATISSNGGNITLAGGIDSGGNPGGYTSQIYSWGHFTANSNGGNILLKSIASAGFTSSYFASADFNAGSGSITIEAQQTGTDIGLFFAGAVNMTSTKNSGTAISLTGTANSSYGVLFNSGAAAVSTIKSTAGGAIMINGSSVNPSSGSIAGIYLFADVLSGSGAITINGGAAGIVMSSSGASVLGQKAGQVETSTSNIGVVANRIDSTAANTGLSFVSSGTTSITSSGASFSSAFNTAGLTFGSTLTSLTIGKVGNTQAITVSGATSIAGPVSLIGGDIILNAGLTATGVNTISLQGSGNVTDGASGFVNATNLRLIGGNVTLDSASNDVSTLAASGVSNLTYVDSNALTVGVVTPTTGISATGAVSLTGSKVTVGANVTSTATTGAGVSITGTSIKHNSGIMVSTSGANIAYTATNSPFTSGDDIAIDLNRAGGTVATINAGGGNIDINASFASSGAAGTGNNDYAIGVRRFRILTSGNGSININGDASNNTGTGSLRGFWLFETKVISGAGAINITGTGGKASSASSGVWIDWANSISSASGAITLTDQRAAGLTGVYSGMLIAGSVDLNRTFLGANGVEVVNSSSPITLRTDALNAVGSFVNILSSGSFTLESVGTTFSTPINFGATFGTTLTGLTIGKTTNTQNITFGAATTIAGPITAYGTNINVNSNLKTTNSGAMYLKGNTTIAAGNHIESNGNFTHDGNLIFKSDATGTAAFGPLGGTFTTVSGLATTERYIPAKRAWRLLTAPVKGLTNTTIPNQWQGVNGEGLLLFSPATYQTQTMTGYTTGGGMPNIWKYNNGWQAIPNLTNENLFTATGTNGFLVFATGPSDSNNTVLGESATTLKPQGQLITGAVPNSIIGNQYNLVANPYASALNTETMVQANLGSKVYMVDPSLGTVGGYFTYDGANWAPTTPSATDKNIQSGQAFFVRTASNSTFSITESHKISGSSTTWFSRTTDTSADKIRVLLYKENNSMWQLADGILAVNSVSGNNEVDDLDTGKLSNFNENILFRNGTANLSIEYRDLPTVGTTQPMRLTSTTVQPYQLRVKTETYINTDLLPYIEDTLTGTVTAIPIDGSEVVLPFTGVAASSTNPDNRFRIIYQSTLNTNDNDILSIAVYPNPVNAGVFTVLLKENTTSASYMLTNLLGQQVQAGKLMQLSNSIDVTSLQIGIYLLQVEQEGKTFSTKLIIK